jgi:hypothetical protein
MAGQRGRGEAGVAQKKPSFLPNWHRHDAGKGGRQVMKIPLRRRAWIFAPCGLCIFLLMAAAYAVRGVYPFGSKVAFYWDGYDQIFPFLGAFREALRSGKDIHYTLNTLFGMDPIALFTYYLASPMNYPAARLRGIVDGERSVGTPQGAGY